MSHARRAIGAIATALALTAACGDDDDPAVAVEETTTTRQGEGTETTGTTEPADATTTTEGTRTVAVEFAAGEVAGGAQRVRLDRGEALRIEVTADVADEVHVHGYDVFADVAPGAPAVIDLVADIPGIFEVELEGRGVKLMELEVR